jgi:hypothetical protein
MSANNWQSAIEALLKQGLVEGNGSSVAAEGTTPDPVVPLPIPDFLQNPVTYHAQAADADQANLPVVYDQPTYNTVFVGEDGAPHITGINAVFANPANAPVTGDRQFSGDNFAAAAGDIAGGAMGAVSGTWTMRDEKGYLRVYEAEAVPFNASGLTLDIPTGFVTTSLTTQAKAFDAHGTGSVAFDGTPPPGVVRDNATAGFNSPHLPADSAPITIQDNAHVWMTRGAIDWQVPLEFNPGPDGYLQIASGDEALGGTMAGLHVHTEQQVQEGKKPLLLLGSEDAAKPFTFTGPVIFDYQHHNLGMGFGSELFFAGGVEIGMSDGRVRRFEVDYAALNTPDERRAFNTALVDALNNPAAAAALETSLSNPENAALRAAVTTGDIMYPNGVSFPVPGGVKRFTPDPAVLDTIDERQAFDTMVEAARATDDPATALQDALNALPDGSPLKGHVTITTMNQQLFLPLVSNAEAASVANTVAPNTAITARQTSPNEMALT